MSGSGLIPAPVAAASAVLISLCAAPGPSAAVLFCSHADGSAPPGSPREGVAFVRGEKGH